MIETIGVSFVKEIFLESILFCINSKFQSVSSVIINIPIDQKEMQ